MTLRREWIISKLFFLILYVFLSMILCTFYLYSGWKVSSVDYVQKLRTENYGRAHALGELSRTTFQQDDAMKENIKEQILLLNQQVEAKEKKDWKTSLSTSIARREIYQVILDQGIPEWEANFHYDWEMEKYLLSNSIPPKDSPYQADGVNLLSMYARDYLPWLAPLLALVFIALSFFLEKWNGGIKLLVQSQKKESTILMEKCLLSWLESLLLCFILGATLFLLGFLFWGYGEWNYPMEIHSLDHVLTSKALVLKNSAIGLLTSLSMALFSTLSVALYRRGRSDLL